MTRKGNRIGAAILTIVLAVTTLFNGITFNNEAKAAEVPESIKMPVVIYDHLADGLLFEYDLYDSVASKLSLEGSSLYDVTGTTEDGQGLIENELGENGTPIYKKEVVERVAEIVKEYIEKEKTLDMDLYNQLVSQIVKTKGSETIILGPEVYDLNLDQLGWSVIDATYAPEDDDDCWKDSDGNIVWYRDGDWLYTNGGTDNKAVFDFGELEAGEYELTYYDATNVDVIISYDGNTVDVTKSGTKFVLDSAAKVTLTVSAKDDNTGNLTAPNLKDASGEKIFKNFTKPQDQKISKIGWIFDADSSWTNSEWGGITCDHGEETDIYYVQDVTPGKTYSLDSHNENDLLGITVTDMEGNKIGEGEDKFTIPSDVDKVKIILSCVCDETETKTIRFDDLVMKEYPDVTLGDYETSKDKFSKGAKLADVSSCMDYAYYMLNSFWTDTNGDITQKTSLYNAIKLNLNDKYYNFSTQNKINYNLENGEISEDTSDNTHLGFFPLDTTLLGGESDLTAPYGAGSDMYNQYDGLDHNYHFSMKVHCEFLYKEEDNLLFKFNGDDDVYLFIDNKLVLDIGGAHEKRDGYVDVNEVAKSIGLEEGEIYTFDFFYMERHTTASNLSIETNMIFEQAEAKPSITYKDENGNVIENGEEVSVSEEIGIEYSVQAGNDGMSDITFNDQTLDVLIGKDGIELGDKGVYVKDAIVVTVYDTDGNVKETYSIDKEDLDDKKKVDAFAEIIGEIVINTDESVTVSGIYKEADYDEFESNLHIDITAPLRQYGDNGSIVTNTESITVIPVSSAITTVPKAYPYTVKYVDKATGDEIADKKTAEANYKYDVTENAIDITGYTLDDTAEKSITIGKSGNEIVFEYTINEYPYTVKYVDKATGEEIAESKTDNAAYKTLVTENAVDIEGYTVSSDAEKSITIDTENNEIIFEYEPNEYPYTVKYVDKETGDEIAESKTADATFGTEVTENAITVPGYGISDDEEKTITIKTEGNEIIFEYEKGKYPYTVKYVDKATGEEIADSKNEAAVFGASVTENAIDIPKYTVSGDAEQSIVIDIENNEIVFQYEKNKVNVEFKADANGSVTGELQQSVEIDGKVSSVATPVPDKGYEFVGWDKTVGEDTTTSEDPGKEVITENTVFTAKFAPLEYLYTVKYVDKVTGEELLASKIDNAAYNTLVTENAVNIEGYTVSGDAEKSITIDTEKNEIVFEYVANEYPYTVKYVDKETGEEIAESKTADATFGTEVTENAITVPGYGISDDAEKTITIKTEGNEIIFEYEKGKYPYTVKYVDKATGEEIADAKNEAATFGANVTENAVNIEGYTVSGDAEKSITIDTEKNEIVFEYVANEYPYTVKYVDKETGEEIAESKTADATFGTEVTENAITVPGYGVSGDAEKTITIKTEGNEIIFEYEKGKYPYTVKYVDKVTGEEIADSKTSNATFAATVTENAIDIPKYTVSGDAEQSIVIDIENNEIVFQYEKNKVNVEFKADANGSVTGELQQSVEIDGNVSSVATPVPDKGYEFVGWVKTTTDGTIVSENPADEVITEDTVFTAKFTPVDYDYVVKYVDKETGKDLVASKTGKATFGTDVTESAVSIEGYTLTGDAEKQITIKVSGNEIIFEYEINKFNVKFEADKNGTVEGDLSQTVNYKDTVSSVATPVPDKGYEFLGWEKTTSDGTIISEKPGEEVITEDTVFTAKFGPLDYGYVVKYVDEEGNALLPETLGEKTTFGTEVSAEAAEITGYTVDEANKSIVIDTENNEIVFVYTKKVYNVTFNTDGNGKIDGTSEMKVKYEETVEEVPGNTANEGYSFTGWTMVAGDGEEVVVEDPATVKITEDTVFTAHYEINSYDYVIKYVDEEGNSISPDVVKSAVYGTTVTETPVVIDGYTAKDGDKSIVIKVEGNEIVFVYTKNADDVSSDRDVNVKDAKDENNNGYGYGEKTKGDDGKNGEGTGNGQQNNGTVSPKTGNIVLTLSMIGSLMLAIMCALYSLLKLRKYSTK